ncbi:MAG: metalloregulator ArsR/SmtB family transcription factor [Planctomycetota bacterium]
MDAVLRAVADPSRRAILDLLAEGEQAVNDLLPHFTFSQPALSKHLRVLREAGLVAVRAAGRRRLYALRAEGLRSVAEWTLHYQRFWERSLDALGAVLDESASGDGGGRR